MGICKREDIVGGTGPHNYSKIQDAINDSENGDTVFVYNDSSPYYENVYINEKVINLVGEDVNTTIIDAGGGDTEQGWTMVVSSSSGFLMRNLTLQNCTTTKGTNYAFFSQHSDNMKIINCCFRDSIHGMCLQYCANTYMRNNRFENNEMNFGLSGWDKASDFINDIDTSNTINGKPMYNLVDKSDVVFDGTAIGWLSLITCENITVKNIKFTDPNMQNILLIDTINSTISNCETYGSEYTCHSIMVCFRSYYNVIENCPSLDGVKFTGNYNTLSNCNLTFGIAFEYGKYNYINNCNINITLDKSGVFGNIFLSNSQYNTISNCTIYTTKYSNFGVGCLIQRFWTWGPGCNYNNIIDNTFYNFTNSAINITYNSTYNKIIGNRIINCSSNPESAGIYITDCSPNDHNIIYNNTFMNNSRDAYDDSNNYWNGSYPRGGNYWDNHTGPDKYRGQYQNLPGYDCIIDASRTIPGKGNNRDWHPLKYLWGENPPVSDYTYRLVNYTIRLDGSVSYDRDGTVESCEWDFGDGTSGSGKKITYTYSKSGMYTIDLNVSDDDGKQGNWSLAFPVPNQVPYAPKEPQPSDGSTDVDVNDDIIWKCSGDPDGDKVTYTVYLEADDSTPDILVSENQTKKSFEPGKMDYSTHYYWRIVAWDVWGGSKSSPVWDFTTEKNAPPSTPSVPQPPDGATNVDIDADLSWGCGDPDGDPLTYNVYFEADDASPDVLVSENQTNLTYDPGRMNHTTRYYWRIVAFDHLGASTSGPVWDFTTRANAPPHMPKRPEPPDGATDVDVNATLSWNCTDPDDDELTYDVYFGTNSSPPKVSSNQSENWYDPGTMNYSTQYYWRIVAWDSYNQSTSGRIWSFTTGSKPNNPPHKPSNPNPEYGSTNVDIDADLSWAGGDPDLGDTVVYDVYLEADDPSPDVQVADDITETRFDPGTLEYDTKYYWRIIAKDNHGASTPGTVWRFTTESAPIPDLSCKGSLNWVDVTPGSTVQGSFTVENKGEPLSLLDWEIADWPKDWGSWTFIPFSGDDLIPEEPCTVNVSVIVPDKKNSEFTGEVKIANTENSSDFCTIDVSLVTPKSKPFSFTFYLLERLLERFLNAFPILRNLLGLLEFKGR